MASAHASGGRAPAASFLRRLAVCLGLLAATLPVLAIEEPEYRVVATFEDFEVRQYAPFVVAEVAVGQDFEAAGSRGFRVLADYIFGNNQTGASIAMTAPVLQRPANTAEVSSSASRDSGDAPQIVGFVMPAGYTLANTPEPVADAVELRRVPARLVAARSYSGFWSEARFRQEEGALKEALAGSGYQAAASAEWARYNGPFTPWFMRRNEVQIEVTARMTP